MGFPPHDLWSQNAARSTGGHKLRSVQILPPIWSFASSNTTFWPCSLRLVAAAMPAMPAPTTRIPCLLIEIPVGGDVAVGEIPPQAVRNSNLAPEVNVRKCRRVIVTSA